MEVQSPRFASGSLTVPTLTHGQRSGSYGYCTSPNRSQGPLDDPFGQSSPAHRRHGGHRAKGRTLTLLPLVALIFYDVSGGPFGVEDAVSSAGALLTLLGFLILPIVWSIPEALITAELSTAFPENSGFVAWVTAAYGPRWGFLEGFFKWLSGVTDNALYPVIFFTYLEQVVPSLFAGASGIFRGFVLVSVTFSLTYLNYRGLHVVGRAAVIMTIVTLLPFVALVIIGAPQVDPMNWLEVPTFKDIDWMSFMNVLFWSTNYWDTVSTLAGEVENPSRTFPKALGCAVVLVIASYIFPLLVGIGTVSVGGKDSEEWKLGFFAQVASTVGGKALGWMVVVSAAVSQLGQFEAEMTTDSYQLLGMSERGFLPEAFSKRSRHGTPTLAIIFSSIGIVVMASFDFLLIVEMLNLIYCMAEILVFASFIKLRISCPDLKRPFRIPLSTGGCILMVAPATFLLGVMLLLPIVRGRWGVILWALAGTVLGIVLYPLLQYARESQLFRFVQNSPEDFYVFLHTLSSEDDDSDGDEETGPI
jgi:amino acid transporter